MNIQNEMSLGRLVEDTDATYTQDDERVKSFRYRIKEDSDWTYDNFKYTSWTPRTVREVVKHFKKWGIDISIFNTEVRYA